MFTLLYTDAVEAVVGTGAGAGAAGSFFPISLYKQASKHACIQHTHITDDINKYIKAYFSPLRFCVHSHSQFHFPRSSFPFFHAFIHSFSYIILGEAQCANADYKYTRQWHGWKGNNNNGIGANTCTAKTEYVTFGRILFILQHICMFVKLRYARIWMSSVGLNGGVSMCTPVCVRLQYILIMHRDTNKMPQELLPLK